METSGLLSLIDWKAKTGYSCEICSKVLSSKNNLKAWFRYSFLSWFHPWILSTGTSGVLKINSKTSGRNTYWFTKKLNFHAIFAIKNLRTSGIWRVIRRFTLEKKVSNVNFVIRHFTVYPIWRNIPKFIQESYRYLIQVLYISCTKFFSGIFRTSTRMSIIGHHFLLWSFFL